MEWSSRNFSHPQVIENSRQYLLLRTDILQKTVVGYPWVYAILFCPFPCRDGRALGAGGVKGNFSRGKMFLFNTSSRLSFCREISHWECWKYHFRAEEVRAPPPTNLHLPCKFWAPPGWNCALPSLPYKACTICLPSKFFINCWTA